MAAILFLSSHTLAKPLSEASPPPATSTTFQYEGCSSEQKTRLDKAFADAATLARYAVDHADMGLTDSTAWSHYFRTDPEGKAGDLGNATAIWSAVALATTPDNAAYTFTVLCETTDTETCRKGIEGSHASWTETEPQQGNTPRVIHVCPYFFGGRDTATVRDLDSRKWAKSTPDEAGECIKSDDLGYHMVAGHETLLQLTHLDALGAFAGLPPRTSKSGIGIHGTDTYSWTGWEPITSRALAKAWQADPHHYDGLPTYRNGGNLASAALEWYILGRCKEVSIYGSDKHGSNGADLVLTTC